MTTASKPINANHGHFLRHPAFALIGANEIRKKKVKLSVLALIRMIGLIPIKQGFVNYFLALATLLTADPSSALIQNGIANFNSHDWDKSIGLEGKWRFYPKTFLQEDDVRSAKFKTSDGIPVEIPGEFEGLIDQDGRRLPHDTWGSLMLELNGVHPISEDLGIQLRADTAYEIFVIDLKRNTGMKSILKVGKVASTASQSIAQIASRVGLWRADGSGHYAIIIHISGFHYLRASIWTVPRLGRYEDLLQEQNLIFLSETFVAGMMFIMMVYYFSLYLHRREDKSALLLSIFSLTIFLRLVGCSPHITQTLFPKPSQTVYEVLRTIEYGMLGLIGSCATLFAAESVQTHRIRKWVNALNALGVSITVFCIVSGVNVFPKYLHIFNAILFTQTLTYMGITAWAVHRKVKGATFLALGGTFLTITVIHDMAIGFGYLHSSIFLAPFGMACLLFYNGQVVARLFASAFRTAHRLSRSLQEEVELKTRRIRSMLDHIPQGVLSLVPSAVTDHEFSKHLTLILGTSEIAGRSLEVLLLDHCRLSSDDKARIMAALSAMFGEDEINFELNQSQLPIELELSQGNGSKLLELNWAPILNSQKVVERIQLTLHDLTQMKAMEQESEDRKREMAFIQEVIGSKPKIFQNFLESSQQLLEENRRLIECNSQGLNEIIKILFVNMHTIKGTARSLKLNNLTGYIHDLEQVYAQLLKDPKGWNQTELLTDLDQLVQRLVHYQHIHTDVLGRQMSNQMEIGLPRDFLEQHCHLLSRLSASPLKPDLRANLVSSIQLIEEQVFRDAEEFFMNFSDMADRIARDLGKETPLVQVSSQNILLNQKSETILNKILIHILRNAIDHGIESTEVRLSKGKPSFGCIRYEITETGEGLSIRIQDDGRGLNLKSLRLKATQSGLAENVTLQDLAELIFKPGLSTAGTVTEISGRGMGMDAIRKYVHDIQGSVQIELFTEDMHEDFCPFQLHIILPSDCYRIKIKDSSLDAAS
jgi:HPt (histidine-containing phosphotransfer) domain-containing protein